MKHTLLSTCVASALMAAAGTAAAPVRPAPQPDPIGAEPLNLLQRYATNTEGRDFVVGDLHGCRALFDAMLVAIGFDKTKDRMFSVGDLVDRGPDSLGCLALLDEDWFKAVAGNHEQFMLQAAAEPEHFNWQAWVAQGGAWATTITREELLDLAVKVAELPLCIVVGDGPDRFNVIHAEFNGPDEALDDALENITTKHPVPLSLTWGRELIEGRADPEFQEGLSLTFVGHSIVEGVSKIGNHVFLDTGAFIAEREGAGSNRGLTIIEPRAGRFWSSAPAAMPAMAA